MDKSTHERAPSVWPLVLAAAAILMIGMGVRQSLGLFIAPLKADRGIDIADISLAFAVSQLVWGVAQPVYGALSERWGTRGVLVLGAMLSATGMALTPFVHSAAMLTLSVGVIAAAGAAAGSFSVLIRGIARHLPVLALLAACLHLPIREARLEPRAVTV